jgi:hypothetical protein
MRLTNGDAARYANAMNAKTGGRCARQVYSPSPK